MITRNVSEMSVEKATSGELSHPVSHQYTIWKTKKPGFREKLSLFFLMPSAMHLVTINVSDQMKKLHSFVSSFLCAHLLSVVRL